MIDKYCRKSGPLGYKEELTSYHVWICKFLTSSVSKRNVKAFLYRSINRGWISEFSTPFHDF